MKKTLKIVLIWTNMYYYDHPSWVGSRRSPLQAKWPFDNCQDQQQKSSKIHEAWPLCLGLTITVTSCTKMSKTMERGSATWSPGQQRNVSQHRASTAQEWRTLRREGAIDEPFGTNRRRGWKHASPTRTRSVRKGKSIWRSAALEVKSRKANGRLGFTFALPGK